MKCIALVILTMTNMSLVGSSYTT